MKRLSELENEAKKAREKVDAIEAEIRSLKTKESFFPFLNDILTEWQEKLRANASPTEGKWKLIIYSHKDGSTLEQFRSSYTPAIFTEPWLAQPWASDKGYDGKAVCVAFANEPESLLPSQFAAMQLSFFHLPFAVCPTALRHPKTLADLYVDDEFDVYAYGKQRIFHETESMDELRPISGIAKPDLRNPEHVRKIFVHQFRPHTASDLLYSVRLKALEKQMETLAEAYRDHRKAAQIRNSLFE